MGKRRDSVTQAVTAAGKPPGKDEFELTLLGPGYGESLVMHVGGGVWVLVDSCIDADGTPRALRYLESIGVDPAETVDLIVATHWHDDHIRGMAKLVEVCKKAAFCCASVLLEKEFLAVVGALENRPLTVFGSGLKEIHGVISRLTQAASKPTLALANRRIFMQGACEIWSLSPNDSNFLDFLKTIGGLLPQQGGSKTRIPGLSPNEVAVALWVRAEDIAVLLGSDLEKRGWIEILQSTARPNGKSSAFKVPHHGSKNAHAPQVWERMLDPDPFAVLTPWRRGRRAVPNQQDVRRILSYTTNAYATAKISSCTRSPVSRKKGRTWSDGPSGNPESSFAGLRCHRALFGCGARSLRGQGGRSRRSDRHVTSRTLVERFSSSATPGIWI